MKIRIKSYFDYRSGSGKRGPWAVAKANVEFCKSSNLVISIWDADKFMDQYPPGSELELPSLEDGLIWEVKPWKNTMFNDITLDQSKITGVVDDGNGSGTAPTGPTFASPNDGIDPPMSNPFTGKLKD